MKPTFATGARRRAVVALHALAMLLAGCAEPGPAPEPRGLELPPRWSQRAYGIPDGAPDAVADAQTLAAQQADWWRRFDEPMLAGLVAQALTRNTELLAARAKLREVRARRAAAAAELMPALGASLSASRSGGGVSSGTTRELFAAGIDASWEADLFGAQRSALAAAEADAAASAEALLGTRLTLAAEVVLQVVELRTTQRRLAVAEQGLASRRESLELAHWRRRAGLASELDVAQASTELDSAAAGVPALQAQARRTEHALALLLGHAPGTVPLPGEGAVPLAPMAIAVGIPADTLRQRPDVRASERRLAAQAARVSQARAAGFPSLRLSGSLGLQALGSNPLGSAGVATRSLLAALSAPLFDGGRIAAGVALQDALYEQAQLAWRTTVLTALQDVENALVALARNGERRERLAQAAVTASRTLAIATQRYAGGLTDYRSVLDAQRSLSNLEDQLAVSSGDLAAAQVALFKALGGGWEAGAAGDEGVPR